MSIHAHEESDAAVGPIVFAGVGLAVVVAFVLLFVFVVFGYLVNRPMTEPRVNPMALEEPQTGPPAPRLQEHPAVEIRELRSREDLVLNTYGWTDKGKGLVRVPVDRAMELALQRGFPTQPAGGGKK